MGKLKYNLKYALSKIQFFFHPLRFSVMSIEDTLQEIERKKSIIRFGDGEFSLIAGNDILFQNASKELSDKLKECLKELDNSRVLLCLPETLTDLCKFEKRVQKNWIINFTDNYKYYKQYCSLRYTYGNAFVSRPYMAYKDKTKAGKNFTHLISLFEDENIYIIEGALSRTGVGNNLFEKAKSISRIICPSKNAYEYIERIKWISLEKVPKDAMVLLALGPTSKPLGLWLVNNGYWVIDIGHIDSEYEWYLKKAETKIYIPFKHTAEQSDDNIENCCDQSYLDSIIATIE